LIEELPATALREWLTDSTRTAPLIIDVREPWEHAICRIEGSQLLPMQDVATRWRELPADRDIVLLCHHGMRSLHVAHFLEDAGLSRLYNLSGGINAWSEQVDPAVTRY
jgi:rhodanese-related sulfurtransferase